ncbi:DEAD/DEAH box helicase [Prochlorococcus sp. MIT 1307]|uniref:DEAD/DEAH box helicase n=1 Tax=Prochlorococcus sp. MIT 1307 TaxID=3096219 RepID=UPI002A754D8B|nr:DEAD/DEAH box helicase [Prochlorococcus sp. MIT 1307]
MCLTSSGLIKVSFPFDAVTQAQLQKIKPRGCWRGIKTGWEFPLSAAKALIDLLGSRFEIKQDLADWVHWFQYPLPPLPPHRELVANAALDSVLRDGRSPFPHQQVGARWLLARRGALLADEMGLGKTLTALLAARAMALVAGVRVMVVAPAGLHSHWLNEANALDLEIDLHSWAALPHNLPPVGTLLVVDEAHFAKSLKSKRTQHLLRLARHPCLRAIWMLTGTPIKNGRPIELYPLLAAMNHPLGEDQRAFEENFCQGHWREHGAHRIWDCSGASNMQELRKLIRPLVLNRCKDGCFGLPPKIREEHFISLSASEARGFEHRLSLVLDEYRSRVQKGLVKSDSESLVILSALRQISAEFKLPSVSNFTEELIKRGNAIVLFSSFIKPLELLNNYLGGVLLTGKTSLEERESAVNSFQKGEENLILTTYCTGGLGYTLHRARHVILLERPWTPGDVVQAEDRCHRIGMNGHLISHWFKLGPADDLVDKLLTNKARNIDFLMNTEIDKELPFSKLTYRFLQEL